MSPGRPPLPPEQRRTERVSVALTQDEYDRLCLTALRLRLEPSTFIRLMLLPDSRSELNTTSSV
jgi:hypothetical protein